MSNDIPIAENKPLGVAMYLRGLAYLNTRENHVAANDLAKAVEFHPTLWPAHAALGRAYTVTWKAEHAVTHFRRAFAGDPSLIEPNKADFAEALSRWGNSLNSANNHTTSIQVLEEALALGPANPKAIQDKLADVYISRGCVHDKAQRYQEAADDFTTAMHWRANYGLAYRNRGLMYQQLDRYREAIADFDEALRLEPDVKKVYRWRAQCYRDLKEYTAALDDMARAQEAEPNSGPVYVDLGYIRECMGEEQLAFEAYSKACEIDKAYARGPYNRAGIYMKRKQYEEALKDLIDAEKLDQAKSAPERDRDIPWRKAEVLQDMRRFDDALDAINSAIAITPQHAPLYNKRGRIYESKGDLKKAIKSYDTALSVDSNNSWAWYYRAGALIKQANFAEAAKNIDEALRLTPSQGWYLSRQATIAWREKRRDDALVAINKAVKLVPNEASFLSDRAWYNYFTGNKEQAWQDYAESVRLDGKSAAVRYNWADALFSEGKYQESYEQITIALEYEKFDGDYCFLQAKALRKLQRNAEALEAINLAIERSPANRQKYLSTRARACTHLGRYAEAKASYEESVPEGCKDVDALNLLAWFLTTCPDATHRDPPRALRLAQKAARLNQRRSAYVIDTLAAALAAVGRFSEAIKVAKEAIALLNGAPDDDNYAVRLELYKRGQPFVEKRHLGDESVQE